jgi:hypothetical protein
LLCFPSEDNKDDYNLYLKQKRTHKNLFTQAKSEKKKAKGVSIGTQEVHVFTKGQVKRIPTPPAGSDKEDNKSDNEEKNGDKQADEKSEKGDKKTLKTGGAIKDNANCDAVVYDEETRAVYEKKAGKTVESCLFCVMMMKLYRLRSQRIVYMSKLPEGELAKFIKKLQHD